MTSGIATGRVGDFSWLTPVLTTAVAGTCAGAACALYPQLALPVAVALGLTVMAALLWQFVGVTVAAFPLLLLLSLTTVIGRDFSFVEIGPLFTTEATLLFVGAAMLVAIGLNGRLDDRPVPRLPLTLFAAYGLIGVVAAVRGFAVGADPYYVGRDAVLVVYAALAVFTVVLFRSLSDMRRVQAVLFWSALPATALAILGEVGVADKGIAVAQGIYVSFFLLAVLTRATQGLRVAAWQWGVVGVQVGLLATQQARATWMALIAAVLVLMLTGSGRARMRPAAWAGAGVTLILAVAIWGPAPVKESTLARGAANSVSGTLAPSPTGTRDAANSQWRLEFWASDLRAVAKSPVTGTGFGPGSSFCFAEFCEDTRLTHEREAFTGPHNSFINVAFRTGVPGIAVLVGLILAALSSARRGLKAVRAEGLTDDIASIRLALATFTLITVTAFFSVALESPHMGIFFWVSMGLLFVAGTAGGSSTSVAPDRTRT